MGFGDVWSGGYGSWPLSSSCLALVLVLLDTIVIEGGRGFIDDGATLTRTYYFLQGIATSLHAMNARTGSTLCTYNTISYVFIHLSGTIISGLWV